MTYLDTPVVAWLYAGETRLMSPRARAAIEQNTALVSPMVALELDFLKEIGRLSVGARGILEHLHTRIGLDVCELSFPRIIASARELVWTRDPFDR